MQLVDEALDAEVLEVAIEDPVSPDGEADAEVVTTRRAITRLVMVAAETAARFERETVPLDPVAWLFAPRRLFGGECAFEACLRLDGFQRAIILHGLSLGYDADPEDIDALYAGVDHVGRERDDVPMPTGKVSRVSLPQKRPARSSSERPGHAFAFGRGPRTASKCVERAKGSRPGASRLKRTRREFAG